MVLDGGVGGVDGGVGHQLNDHHQHQVQRLACRQQVGPLPLSQALGEEMNLKLWFVINNHKVYT